MGGLVAVGLVAVLGFVVWCREAAFGALWWTLWVDRLGVLVLLCGLAAVLGVGGLGVALAHHEGALYDKVYSGVPEFQTEPNRLLMEVVDQRRPGKALDVGMGQGRNALALARQG